MRLAPTDEQFEFVDAVTSVLRDMVTPATLRQRRDGGGFDIELWSALGSMGLFGALVPQTAGGLDLTFVDVVLLLEQIGIAGTPAPVLEAAVVVAPLLAATGSEPARRALEDLVAGRVIATAALGGLAAPVADAATADLIAVVADRPLVGPRAAFDIRPQTSFDPCRRVAMIEPIEPWVPDMDDGDVAVLQHRVIVANASQLLGVCEHLLDVTVDYAAQRNQFGRPIGSFQSVKHQLADVHVELVSGRAAVLAAAVLDAEGDPVERSIAAHVAAAHVADAALRANHVALQVHGGIGYSWEHDLQLWLKSGLVLARRLGSPAMHRRQAALLAGVIGRAS